MTRTSAPTILATPPRAAQSYSTPLLRAEGLTASAAALVCYFSLTNSWVLIVTALLPDLAMIGYAFGPRIGARAYNAAHTYVAPALLVALALSAGLPLLPVACVWAAHIGIDRALGYGLKHPSGFHITHLGRIGRTSRRRVA